MAISPLTIHDLPFRAMTALENFGVAADPVNKELRPIPAVGG
jgi:hypothetical protein